jgi:hypothetical protein
VAIVLVLMGITSVGVFGFLSRANIQHQVVATQAVDRDAAPLAQQTIIAEATVKDFDGRIVQVDDMVKAATAKARAKTAMTLVQDHTHTRADLVSQRQAAASRLADLRVQQAGIDAHRQQVVAEVGPALYIAKLFGSDDIDAAIRLITLALVLVLDPLAVLLTIAASRR